MNPGISSTDNIYAVADLATIRIPKGSESDQINFPGKFLGNIETYAAKLDTEQENSAIWGGASKGVLFALFMQRAGSKVDMVIDINPAKQGKFLAATGLQVWSPSEALPKLQSGANVFVMNGNYLDEVRELTANQFKYVLVEHVDA